MKVSLICVEIDEHDEKQIENLEDYLRDNDFNWFRDEEKREDE